MRVRIGRLDLAALAGEPLVLPPDDFSLTRQVRDAFRTIGAEPLIVAQSGQWDFLVAMAATGLAPLMLIPPRHYLSHAARAWLAVCEAVLTPAAMG